MATKVKTYRNTLNAEISDVEEWFEQYSYHLYEEGLVHPVLPDVDPTADQIAAYNNMDKRISAHFLTSISFEFFVLLKSLISPRTIVEVQYSELRDTLTKHLKPKPTTLAERFKFYKTVQQPGESEAEFIAKLRLQATKCGFTEFEQALLDQFICGISNKAAQEALLEEEVATMTLETAYQKCVAISRSKREAQMFSNSTDNASAPVNKVEVRRKMPSKDQLLCRTCGLAGHLAAKCKTRCFKCNQQGHIKMNCTSQTTPKYHRGSDGKRGRGRGRGGQTSRGRFRTNVNAVEDDHGEFYEFEHLDSFNLYYVEQMYDSHNINNEIDIENLSNVHFNSHNIDSKCNEIDIENLSNVHISNDSIFSMNVLKSTNNGFGKPMVDVRINGIQMSMEIDCGASVSVCSKGVLDSAGVSVNLVPSSMKLKVANGQWEPVLGKALVTVCAKNQVARLELYVTSSNFPTLLGRSWIRVFCGNDWLDKLWGNNETGQPSQSWIESVEQIEQSDGNSDMSMSGTSVELGSEQILNGLLKVP